MAAPEPGERAPTAALQVEFVDKPTYSPNDPRGKRIYLQDYADDSIVAVVRDEPVVPIIALNVGLAIKLVAVDRQRGQIYCVSLLDIVYRLEGDAHFVAGGARGYIDGRGADAQFGDIAGICVRRDGTLVVADRKNNCIRTIAPGRAVDTLAGSRFPGSIDGRGRDACFESPMSLGVDSRDNVFVAENLCIRMVTPCGLVTTIAGHHTVRGSCDGPGLDARFWGTGSLAVDSSDRVYLMSKYSIWPSPLWPGVLAASVDWSIRTITPTDGGLLLALAAVPHLSCLPRALLPLVAAYIPATAAVATHDSRIREHDGLQPPGVSAIVCSAGTKAVYRIAMPANAPSTSGPYW